MSDVDRRTLRTLVQLTLALAVALPGIVESAGLLDSAPWVAVLVGVAAGLTRIMAALDPILPAWLRAHPPVPEPADEEPPREVP